MSAPDFKTGSFLEPEPIRAPSATIRWSMHKSILKIKSINLYSNREGFLFCNAVAAVICVLLCDFFFFLGAWSRISRHARRWPTFWSIPSSSRPTEKKWPSRSNWPLSFRSSRRWAAKPEPSEDPELFSILRFGCKQRPRASERQSAFCPVGGRRSSV